MGTKVKVLLMFLGLFLPTTWYGVYGTESVYSDGYSHIIIQQAQVQGIPKGDAIEATINGHVLSVVFTENLGQVSIELSSVIEGEVDYAIINTPNGINFIITYTGSYIVTFTLENGDTYYGEFEVTD